MANEFSLKPQLDTDFPKPAGVWTCPITGFKVPKNPSMNLEWRADMLEAADDDYEFREDLYTACSNSLLFFVNAFAFTLRIFEPSEPHPQRRPELTALSRYGMPTNCY